MFGDVRCPFVNGLIDANLIGPGTNSNGDSIVLNESLFEFENLKVGFSIMEDGVEKLALVELTSQPFAIKSARADYAHSAGDTEKIQAKRCQFGTRSKPGIKLCGWAMVPYPFQIPWLINAIKFRIET